MNSGGNFFFFGTLMDLDVLEVVLDSNPSTLSMSPASLKGYAVYEIEHSFEFIPVVAESPNDIAEGIFIRGLTDVDVERVSFFEDTEYQASSLNISLEDGTETDALVWLGTIFVPRREQRWMLERWQRDHKPLFMAQTRSWMSHYGKHGSDEQDRIEADVDWQQIRQSWPDTDA